MRLGRPPKVTWKDKDYPHTVGSDEFAYRHIPQSVYEWVDPQYYLPLPYDMCELETDKKIRHGWWNGREWESLRLKPDEIVYHWRRTKDE